MNYGKFFAWAILALSLLAAVGYAIAGDWKRAGYWAAASYITWSVT